MTNHRDAIAATLSLVLGVAAMAGVLATDLYAQAAGAEARGVQALFQQCRRPDSPWAARDGAPQ